MNTRPPSADGPRRATCRCSVAMPLTVDFVSLLLGVRQACADCGADLGIVPLAHAGTLELEPVCAVNDAVQDRVPDCVVAITSCHLPMGIWLVISSDPFS